MNKSIAWILITILCLNIVFIGAYNRTVKLSDTDIILKCVHYDNNLCTAFKAYKIAKKEVLK